MENNNLGIKLFEGNEVEVIVIDDKALFNANQVGYCLEISDTKSSIRNFTKSQKIKVKNSDVHTMHHRKLNNAGETFLTEAGVFRLIFKSRKKDAENFQNWVTDEVLPSIRKHGAYITETTLNEMIQSPDTMIKVLQNLKEEQEKNKQLENRALEMLPKVEQYNNLMNSHDLLSMNETAKSIGVGRNDLFNLLRNKGVLMSDKKNKKDHNVPYQRYIDSKYFTVVEHEIMGETQPQTFVSTKGLEWLSKKLSNKWKDELKNIKKEIIEDNSDNQCNKIDNLK